MITRPSAPSLRSLLYVPGDRGDWLPGALASGADALIIDLEDAVPNEARAAVREGVSEFVREHRQRLPLFVRVAAPSSIEFVRDLEVLVQAGAFGIVIPKVASALDVQIADRLVGWSEAKRPATLARTILVPLLETARAMADARELARASTRCAYMGGIATRDGDVQRALGYRWTPAGRETLVMRAKILLDLRAAGHPHPVTGVWTDVENLDGLEAFALQGRELGYEGMAVIHPSHVVNGVFGLHRPDIEYYQELVDAAGETGRGAIRFRGHMVDQAMVQTALAELARAGVSADGGNGE
jgi:citrate lyase subunit beta/citryl-CoA lyase